jgi:AmiR/NasT family two-component response regulator
MVIVDADQGWDGLLPWVEVHPPLPVVALLGSEAPGRIAWALEQGAGAIIAKPIATSAVYPALVMAVAIHSERRAAGERLRHLEERMRMRPLIHAAVQRIMDARNVDEEGAYGILRSCAMQRRLSMEQLSAFIIGGSEPLPEAV